MLDCWVIEAFEPEDEDCLISTLSLPYGRHNNEHQLAFLGHKTSKSFNYSHHSSSQIGWLEYFCSQSSYFLTRHTTFPSVGLGIALTLSTSVFVLLSLMPWSALIW